MRRRRLALGVFGPAIVIAAACAHDEHAAVAPVAPLPACATPSGPAGRAPAFESVGALGPSSYLLADPASRASSLGLTPLPDGVGVGLIVDGIRLVARGASSLQRAAEVTDPPLTHAMAIPPWLGGGFLFRSRTALYTAGSFDGDLRPLSTFPSEIEGVALGPKAALVRGELGERWALDLASGARVASSPAAVSDIGALADGRALALTERGAALVSADGGDHWVDVTPQLAHTADEIVVTPDALWIVPSTGPAFRVEAGGNLAAYDKPLAGKPAELRARDPRWHNDEAPLRRALRLGVPMEDGTALVYADGDLVRVNVMTGEIASVMPSHLPPEVACDALRTVDDVLLVCAKPSGNGGAFVASHAGSASAPVVEQMFPATGQFYAADDGALAFAGPCARAKTSRAVACVRGPGGSWHEVDVEPFVAADAGSGAAIEIARWVPRADGSAVALFAAPSAGGGGGGGGAGALDARNGDVRPWQLDGLTPAMRGALAESRSRGAGREGARLVDRTWTATAAGGLRAWGDGGAAFDVAPDGVVTASPFFFDRVAISGPFAYARTRDGRAWQTVDRGSTWSEVVAPPSARAGSYQEPRFCSAVGCDLSAWYRVGWSAAAPSAPSPVSVASAPPHVARVAKATVTCRPAGEPKITTLPRTELSPEDFGLGATRVPAGDDGKTEYVRATFVRTVSNPVHELEASSDRDYPAARAVVYGRDLRSLSDDGAALARQLLGLRRHVTFVAPFDPLAAVRRATLTAGDVVAAARGIGLRAADVLTPDLLTVLAFVPVTSSDPSAPGDLAFLAEGGLLGVLRGSGATRVRVGPRLRSTDDVKLASAVALGGDEYAFLEVGENGASEVTKLGAAGVTSLFDLPPVVGPLSYPENPDALAVGPHGEVVVLRVRSGAEPPSALEPALVLGPLGVTTVLAPWSTLTAADDAACKADSAGYRATIQAVGAWVTVAGLDVRVHDDGVMSARVRWSSARVCLEGLEVRVDDTRVTVAQRASGGGSVSRDAATMTVQPVESIVVARFAGGASAARVGILPGVEARAPLTCSVGP